MIHPQIYVGLTKDYEKEAKKVKSQKQILQLIIEATCEETNLQPTLVLSKCRDRELVYARHIIRVIACQKLDTSMTWIANELGCNHATIIHSKKVVADLIFTDKKFKNTYENCQFRFKIKNAIT